MRPLVVVVLAVCAVASEDEVFKIVGLVPVRNEERRIGFCLQALAAFTDSIVVLDDSSDDRTVEVVRSLASDCRVERIITKDGSWSRNETADRNMLLEAGRDVGGTHFIVLDADEAFTANLAEDDELRKQILSLEVGQNIALHWIQLWKSTQYYRIDRLYDGEGIVHEVLGSQMMPCIFRDDGTSWYEGEFIHTRRIPEELFRGSVLLRDIEIGLLHFQFVDWRNFILKQAWYKCFERIQLPDKPIGEINVRYSGSLDTVGERVATVPSSWFDGYSDFFTPGLFEQLDNWRIPILEGWFEEKGYGYFAEIGALRMLHEWHVIPDFDPPSEMVKHPYENFDLLRHKLHSISFIVPPLGGFTRSRSAVESLLSSLQAQTVGKGKKTSWEAFFSACSEEEAEVIRGDLTTVNVVVVDCSNIGASLNKVLRETRSSVITFVTGCVHLGSDFVERTLRWFCPSCELGEEMKTTTINAILSYPERAVQLQEEGLRDLSRVKLLDEALPLFPADAQETFKPHWRWSGGVVSSSWVGLASVNGFPEDEDLDLFLQIDHYKDRAAICKFNPFLAPASMNATRLVGHEECSLSEVPDYAMQVDGQGFPPGELPSMKLLDDLRERRRKTLAMPGIMR